MRDAAEAVVERPKLLAGLRFVDVVCRQSVSSDRTSRLSGDGPATRIIHQRRSGFVKTRKLQMLARSIG